MELRHVTPALLSLAYMFSNWSTLLFVLPFLTSLKVLYLSLPCFTFSLWILSIVVSALKKHKIEEVQTLVLAYLVVPGVSKVLLQTSQLALKTFVLFGKG